MSTCTIVADVLEATRVCKLCGIGKPISDFDVISGYYRKICRECYRPRLLAQKRGWYLRHREAILNSRRGYYQVHQESILNKVRERRRDPHYAKQELVANLEHYTNMRKMALGYYGGECECCGEMRYEMLTFDHINGGGRKAGVSGLSLVYAVIEEYNRVGYPNDKYRILCWNCNMSISNYGYCPHNSGWPSTTTMSYDTRRGKRIKIEMISAFGGRCRICGEDSWEFLTLDHINGDGKEDRKENGAGRKFYASLRRRGWSQDGLRLLCSNCNCSMGR